MSQVRSIFTVQNDQRNEQVTEYQRGADFPVENDVKGVQKGYLCNYHAYSLEVNYFVCHYKSHDVRVDNIGNPSQTVLKVGKKWRVVQSPFAFILN
jgi:hypothetical protein